MAGAQDIFVVLASLPEQTEHLRRRRVGQGGLEGGKFFGGAAHNLAGAEAAKLAEPRVGEDETSVAVLVEDADGHLADQRMVKRLRFLQLLFHLPALGDVADDGNHVFAIHADEPDIDLHLKRGAVFAPLPRFDYFETMFPHGRHGLVPVVKTLPHNDVGRSHGQQFLAPVTQPLAGGFVDVQKAAGLRINDLDAIIGMIDQGAE